MSFSVVPVCTETQLEQARSLVRAYVETGVVDLTSQNIEAEIDGLPWDYRPPTGALFIATEKMGEAVRCIAIHKFGLEGDAEIKRLFVKADHRGRGIGAALLNKAIEAGKQMKCNRIVLDTLPTMTAAVATYKSLGFEEIAPYWCNVLPVIFLGKELEPAVEA